MSKRIRVVIEPPYGGAITEYFDVEDDTPEEQIEEEAREIFGNYCSYGWSAVEPDDEDAA